MLCWWVLILHCLVDTYVYKPKTNSMSAVFVFHLNLAVEDSFNQQSLLMLENWMSSLRDMDSFDFQDMKRHCNNSKSSCYVCTYLGDTLGGKSLCRALMYNCLMWCDMCICSSLCLQPYGSGSGFDGAFTRVCVSPKVFKPLLWGRLLSASRFPCKFNVSRWNRFLTWPACCMSEQVSVCGVWGQKWRGQISFK